MNKNHKNYNKVLAKYNKKIGDLSIRDARIKEISFVKRNIETNAILLKGEKGTGKTTIIKEATKSLQEGFQNKKGFGKTWFKKPKTFELDLTKISYDDILKNRIARYLNWRGKITYLSAKESIYNIFKKIVLPFWAFITPIIPIYFNYLPSASNLLIAILSIVFGLPLVVIFVVSPFLRKIYKRKWRNKSKKIVVISEINFLSNEKMQRVWGTISKILDIYKNNYLIFEVSVLNSRHLEDKLEDKYEMKVIEVNNGKQYLRIFEIAIEILNEWVLSTKNQGLEHLWKIESRSLEIRKFQFPNLINNLSFREIKILCRNIIYKYIVFNGEINIWDYVNVFYLSRKNKKLLNELTNFGTVETLDANNLIRHLVKREVILENDKKFKKVIINLYSFQKNKTTGSINNLENREFLFCNTKYQANYFDTIEGNPMTSESLDSFFSNPVEAILKAERNKHDIGNLLIDTISDSKCVEIIEKIINYNLEELLVEDKKLYKSLWRNGASIQATLKQMIDTRGDTKAFYEKLSPQLKFICLRFYAITKGVTPKEVERFIEENQFDKKWRKYILKNVLWWPFVGHKSSEIQICSYDEYVDFMLNKGWNDNLATQITCKHYDKKIGFFFITYNLSKRMLEELVAMLLNLDKEKDVFYKDENQQVKKWPTSNRTKLTAKDVKEEFDP